VARKRSCDLLLEICDFLSRKLLKVETFNLEYRLAIKGNNEKCAKLGQKRGEVDTLLYLVLEFRDPSTSLERLKLFQIRFKRGQIE